MEFTTQIIELLQSGGEGAFTLAIVWIVKSFAESLLMAGVLIWIVKQFVAFIKTVD